MNIIYGLLRCTSLQSRENSWTGKTFVVYQVPRVSDGTQHVLQGLLKYESEIRHHSMSTMYNQCEAYPFWEAGRCHVGLKHEEYFLKTYCTVCTSFLLGEGPIWFCGDKSRSFLGSKTGEIAWELQSENRQYTHCTYCDDWENLEATWNLLVCDWHWTYYELALYVNMLVVILFQGSQALFAFRCGGDHI